MDEKKDNTIWFENSPPLWFTITISIMMFTFGCTVGASLATW